MEQDPVDVAIGIDFRRWEEGLHEEPLTAQELLGRAVLRLRLYRGWSQRDLEIASGVDQTTISRLETSRRGNVGARRLAAIIEALGATDVVLVPHPRELRRTTLELMLYGDPWERACRAANERVERRRARQVETQSPS